MDLIQAMKERHSVRAYTDKRIEGKVKEDILREIEACNKEGRLSIKLVTDEPDAFGGFMAHYGSFSNVKNYIILAGKKSSDLNERLGYYGERIVLRAQQLGLNTCWVALTFNKGKSKKLLEKGNKLVCVISIGYGKNQGFPHKNRSMESLCSVNGKMPDWFENGMKAAMLAPTATNQQKFRFVLNGSSVEAESTGGFYSHVDLGIVKYHFEIGAGRENFVWV